MYLFLAQTNAGQGLFKILNSKLVLTFCLKNFVKLPFCHHGMAHFEIANGQNGLHIWSVTE
jgi:hypothetical protein